MGDWLQSHHVIDTVVLFWIFNAIVNALPEPGPDATGVYKFIYTFLTTILGHLSDAINRGRRAPGPDVPNQAKS
jgi:hypothetical protein